MILILTDESDRLQSHVIPVLEKKGAASIRFNTADFPQKTAITIRYNDDCEDELSLSKNGECFDLRDVRTVWYRRPGPPVADPSASPEDREFIRRESVHVLGALWHLLRDRFWVNPYQKSNTAEHKPYQLQVARAVGLEVPRTLITNEPNEVREFYKRCGGQIIYKCFTQYARRENGTGCGIYTSRVASDALETHVDQVGLAPCIFQEYVPKKHELRVTVIGRKIFTSEIDSQSTQHSKDDWRRYMFVQHAPQRASDLPDWLKAKIHAMLQQMGLVFGCLDFVVTPDGRFVFLELNPNGQWYWVEEATGMPLVDNFTEMLVEGTSDYNDPVTLLPSAISEIY